MQPHPPETAPARTRHPDPLPHDRYRWTAAKALAFLDDLAQHGNVAQAARSVGMTRQSAYRLRDRAPTVAQAWPLALAAGMKQAASVPTRAEARRAAARQRQEDAAWFAQGLRPHQGDTATRQRDTHPRHRAAACRQGDAFPADSDNTRRQGDRA